MKRLICLSVLALLGLSVPGWAGWFECCNHGIHCIVPPCPDCPDCSDPCCHRHGLTLGGQEHCCKLIEELHACCCCDRVKAAHKLGCRLHADFCACPELLPALVHALQCDTCWEVRREAAWAIAYQGARTRLGVLALYLASKLDPHYMVRDAATDALDVLLVCRRDCFKDLFAEADELAKQLKPNYQPTKGQCVNIFDACCGLAGVGVDAGMAAGAVVEGMPGTRGAVVGTTPMPSGVVIESLPVTPRAGATPYAPMPK
jgi:hypothetical protein